MTCGPYNINRLIIIKKSDVIKHLLHHLKWVNDVLCHLLHRLLFKMDVIKHLLHQLETDV